MIKFLLPLLIGYTGGRMVHGQRGAVVGAVATVGIIVGSDVPMFLGAMIIGPLDRVPAEAVRRPGPRSATGPGSRCWSTTSPPASSARAMARRRRLGASARSSEHLHPLGRGRRRAGWSTTTCCRSPRCSSSPPRCCSSTTPSTTASSARSASTEAAETRQVDPVHAGVQPRPRPRRAPGVPVLRPAPAAPEPPAAIDHPLPRRHPRDLLPVHPHEAADDPRRDRGRRDRGRDLHGLRRRPRRHPVARQHLRLPRADAARRPGSASITGMLAAAAVSFAVGAALLGFGRLAEPRERGRGAGETAEAGDAGDAAEETSARDRAPDLPRREASSR